MDTRVLCGGVLPSLTNYLERVIMETLYVVGHWMPFPSSEYGGVQVVVASSDAECERILAETVDEYYRNQYPNYRERIANEIKEAKRFPVDTTQHGVVYEFLT
jgi:hypothetical protein